MIIGKEKRRDYNPDFLPAPEKIISHRPFIAVCDLDTVVSRIDKRLDNDEQIQAFQSSLLDLQKRFAPEGSSFYQVNAGELVRKIEQRASNLLKTNTRGLINFDRYIFPGVETNDHHFRVELSRSNSNVLVSRPGSSISPEVQLMHMLNWISENHFESLTLVDDVVAFASTFPPIIQEIRQRFPNIPINVLAGICSSKNEWSGLEKLEALGLEVNSVIIAEASPTQVGDSSGMAIPDSRDSTIFGGKIGILPDGRPASYPYFLPFSVPTTSLMRPDVHQQASLEWLRFNIDLVHHIDSKLDRHLVIGDLVENGFGVPFTSVEELKEKIEIPENEASLFDYLLYIQEILVNNKTNR